MAASSLSRRLLTAAQHIPLVARAATRIEVRRRRRHDARIQTDAAESSEIDGLPVPPSRLRHLVAGTTDLDDFVRTGERHATAVRSAVRRAGEPFDASTVVADVGCGCGRLLRHWVADGATLLGGDVNPELVGWVGTNLPVEVFDIGSNPPTALADRGVDVLVAYSVLTHLTPGHQQRWLADWTRVVRPGGLLVLTTHGVSRRAELGVLERRRFDDGRPVVRHASAVGDNLCSTFLPEPAARRLFAQLEILEHTPPAAEWPWDQDLWVLRTPS